MNFPRNECTASAVWDASRKQRTLPLFLSTLHYWLNTNTHLVVIDHIWKLGHSLINSVFHPSFNKCYRRVKERGQILKLLSDVHWQVLPFSGGAERKKANFQVSFYRLFLEQWKFPTCAGQKTEKTRIQISHGEIGAIHVVDQEDNEIWCHCAVNKNMWVTSRPFYCCALNMGNSRKMES